MLAVNANVDFGGQLDFGAGAVALDDDRAGADFGELRAGRDVRAERYGTRRFATDTDDRGTAVVEREDAEQVDVLHGILVELTAEERRGVLGADRQPRGGGGQRRFAGGQRDDPIGGRRAQTREEG
ncbi:hypothetical protein BGV71_16175 [Burkholderia ubonensis]|nr:hypothetical protein BGV71_16175 [Burkholderia ubonensis]